MTVSGGHVTHLEGRPCIINNLSVSEAKPSHSGSTSLIYQHYKCVNCINCINCIMYPTYSMSLIVPFLEAGVLPDLWQLSHMDFREGLL